MALTSSTVPRLVSRNEPTGICLSAVRGTKSSPFWLARAAAEGVATSTVPRTTDALTVSPNTGPGTIGPS